MPRDDDVEVTTTNQKNSNTSEPMDVDDEGGTQDTQPAAASHDQSPPVEHPSRVDEPEDGWQQQGRMTIEQSPHSVMVFHPSARRLGCQTAEAYQLHWKTA
ncbi:hypothetical protein PsorP6_017547 [Peronosclerospora sorghi]|uniref:Uncharacterized protein n=1 Tax=Peronosclerospora sorghi TaxID=230839 RepID=A0ACC0WL15_9STRA|nr:hypothetical protein PsorP6_017547 [Peronosclerospora sorghi]